MTEATQTLNELANELHKLASRLFEMGSLDCPFHQGAMAAVFATMLKQLEKVVSDHLNGAPNGLCQKSDPTL